jgi:DNA ligase-1
MFSHLDEFVASLRSTSSTLEKTGIIKSACSNTNCKKAEFLRSVLLFTYHPTWQYFVTSDNLKKYSSLRGGDYKDLFELLNDLKNRVITGHDAIGATNSFVERNKEHENLIHCIIDKDLKTRAGDKIINKAIPNLIPEFSVALADKYDSKIVDWSEGWFVSRKIDGARCIAIVDDLGNPSFFSRTGKTFDTLEKVAQAIRSLKLKNVVFDGELCLVDDEGNEDFQGVMKELRKKNHTIPNPSYKIFDMLNHYDFYSQKSKETLSERLLNLKAALDRTPEPHNNNLDCLTLLHQEKIKNEAHFAEWSLEATKCEWEGLMLRKDVFYKGKRSKDLLKYKSFFDDEYKVIDVEMGPFRYVKDGAECEETMLSCVTIGHKGYNVRVGSGFTIDQRQEFYQDPSKILGKTILVQYFAETENQEGGISLRFPTFKYLYGENREV